MNRPPAVVDKPATEDTKALAVHGAAMSDAVTKTREDLVNVYKDNAKLLAALTEVVQKKKKFRATAMVVKRDAANRISSISLDMEEI